MRKREFEALLKSVVNPPKQSLSEDLEDEQSCLKISYRIKGRGENQDQKDYMAVWAALLDLSSIGIEGILDIEEDPHGTETINACSKIGAKLLGELLITNKTSYSEKLVMEDTKVALIDFVKKNAKSFE